MRALKKVWHAAYQAIVISTVTRIKAWNAVDKIYPRLRGLRLEFERLERDFSLDQTSGRSWDSLVDARSDLITLHLESVAEQCEKTNFSVLQMIAVEMREICYIISRPLNLLCEGDLNECGRYFAHKAARHILLVEGIRWRNLQGN